MEFLALIAAFGACVFLIQNIKAKARIALLRRELAAKQHFLKITNEDAAALKSELDQTRSELERFKDVVDAQTEAARILDETRKECDELLQHSHAKVHDAEDLRKQAVVDAEAVRGKLLGRVKLERDQLLSQAQSKVNQAESRLQQAEADAAKIVANAQVNAAKLVADAQLHAEHVLGRAPAAMDHAEHCAHAATTTTAVPPKTTRSPLARASEPTCDNRMPREAGHSLSVGAGVIDHGLTHSTAVPVW